MDKPTAFFSHSPHDAKPLRRLKDLFVQKTGSTIDVFLSSDGQSIPLGSNWVASLQDALERTKLMFVFLTPSSVDSKWVYFESGFVHAKRIRVVPIGMFGIDLAQLRPPISLLQGFNITSAEGLNNLIAVANEVFDFNHLSRFSGPDFDELQTVGGATAAHPLGDYGGLVDEVVIEINSPEIKESCRERPLSAVGDALKSLGIPLQWANNHELHIEGMTLTADDRRPPFAKLSIDPLLLAKVQPTVEQILGAVRTNGARQLSIRLDLYPQVDRLHQHHKVTARLLSQGVRLADQKGFTYQNVYFDFDNLMFMARSRPPQLYIEVRTADDGIDIGIMRLLLDLLFERCCRAHWMMEKRSGQMVAIGGMRDGAPAGWWAPAS